MLKLAKAIRVLTVAPICAALMLTILYFSHPELFGGALHYGVALLTLTVLPLLAYPISLLWKKEVRRGYQRSLAIDLSIVGYVIGVVFSIATRSPAAERVIYLTYLLSGAAIAVFSFVLKRKSSGHTCGLSGPIAVLVYYASPIFSAAFALIAPVFWASLKMKRHTLPQLIAGTLIPIVALAAAVLIIGQV